VRSPRPIVLARSDAVSVGEIYPNLYPSSISRYMDMGRVVCYPKMCELDLIAVPVIIGLAAVQC